MNKFTRQETIALTGATSSRLSYLDRMKIVVPEKYGVTKKPAVFYSLEQVLQITIINELRQQISNELAKDIVRHINRFGFDANPRHLVIFRTKAIWQDNNMNVVENTVAWMDDWNDVFVLIKAYSDLGAFTMVFLPNIPRLIGRVWQNASDSHLIDFESFQERAKRSSR